MSFTSKYKQMKFNILSTLPKLEVGINMFSGCSGPLCIQVCKMKFMQDIQIKHFKYKLAIS